MSKPVANADIFQEMAEPTRRAILDQIQDGEQPVKQLAELFEMSLPTISSTYKFCVKRA